MAKRKPSIKERKARTQRRSDDELLKRYASHCYQMARAERAIELKLPISAIVPIERQRHQAVLNKTHKAIRKWFYGMPHKARARAKIRVELGIDPKPKAGL